MNVDALLPRVLVIAFGSLLPAIAGRAQAVDSTPPSGTASQDETAIMLSPFEVTPEMDRGYQPTAILQGGRGRIDLADVAGQVHVFTKEFMEDLGAVDDDELLQFSATTQSYFDNVDPDGDNRAALRNPSGTSGSDDGINSRGLGGLERTRNFFRTSLNADSYNTERVTLVSGANAVQFGLGGPAGTIETSTARANLTRNRQRMLLRTDSYGSERGVLDINQVLIPGKLAVRGIGLRENREYFLRPGYEDNRKGFGTITYRPFSSTTIRVEGEYVYRKENRPSTVVARDRGYMSWLQDPIVYNNRPATAGTSGRPAAPKYTMLNGATVNYGFNNRNALFILPETSDPAFSGMQDVRNTVIGQGVNIGSGPSLQSLVAPGYPWNVNSSGYSRYTQRRTRNLTATIEQRLGSKTYLELGWSWEYYRHLTSSIIGTGAHDVRVDINRYLPDGATPNPMYGRAYMEGTSSSSGGAWTDFRIEQYRATLTHELDLTQASGWTRHLGRHRLAAFLSYDDNSTYNLGNNRFMIIGNPSFLSPAAQANPLSAERMFNVRYYLPAFGSTDDPAAYGFPNLAAYGDLMGIMTFIGPGGEPFQVTEFQNPVGYVANTPTAKHMQRGSGALSTSSSFFRGNFVVNFGIRHDRVRNSDFASSAFPPIRTENPNGTGIQAYDDFRERIPADDWTPYRKATRANYGFVVRPPKVGKWFSLAYDYSRNASLESVAVVRDINGAELETPYGEAHEYSVRLALLENRLHLKVNYFNALQRNTNLSDAGLRAGLIRFEQRLYEIDPGYPINPLLAPEADPRAADFKLPGDRNSKGIEVSLTYNPTRNWRFFWNLGRTDTEVDDISAEPWWNYLNSKLAVWKGFNGNWSTAIYEEGETVEAAWQAEIGNRLEDIQANLGNPGGNSQTWRSALVATHMFSGRLKGASASVNFRYRGPRIIGFPEYVDARGQTRLDYDNPYKSDDYILTGAMLNYRFKGFGRTSWRVQLNANNIFNTARFFPTRTFPDGTPGNFGRQPGREFILSVDVSH